MMRVIPFVSLGLAQTAAFRHILYHEAAEHQEVDPRRGAPGRAV